MKRNLVIATLALGFAIGILQIVRERKAEQHPHFATTEQFISYACDRALTDAQSHDHVQLDYSVSSLKQVDQILGRVHDAYVTNPSSISVPGVSAEYGAYVGEVIRRNEPNAYWTRDSKLMGEKAYPLHWNGGESYPFAWCSKRITAGDEDSIWIKYSILKDESVKKATPAAVNAASPQ